MKIRVYIDEKNKLMCDIPGEEEPAYLMEFYLAMDLLPKEEFMKKFGATMPEIVVDCFLTPHDPKEAACISMIDEVRRDLLKLYGGEKE